MQEQKSQAGFEYYLSRLEQEKERERARMAIAILSLLESDPAVAKSLESLISLYFPYNPTRIELVEFNTLLRKMVDDQLISMHMPGVAGRDEFQKLEFSITDSGKTYLETFRDSQLEQKR